MKNKKTYGPAGKLIFDRDGNPKIVDRLGSDYPNDLALSTGSVISVHRRNRWQDLLVDHDGEQWVFKTEKGTIIPLSGQYRARVRYS